VSSSATDTRLGASKVGAQIGSGSAAAAEADAAEAMAVAARARASQLRQQAAAADSDVIRVSEAIGKNDFQSQAADFTTAVQ
jgi:hypothetical protein